MNPLTAWIIQNDAGPDPAANLARVLELLRTDGPVDLICLPELFSLRGGDEDYRKAARHLPDDVLNRLAEVAREKRCWILAGSVLERSGDHIYNTSVLLNRIGDVAAMYRKIHLFEVHLENQPPISERRVFSRGHQPVLAEIDDWRCGLSICYDLRFPELYREYAGEDAHLLFVPSNFTAPTGRDHWVALLRARAIENQCYVIAPNQCGTNPVTGVASYGHSLAIDPWGTPLAEAADAETVLRVELDPAVLEQVRKRLPALAHRRLS
jgi:predicted amidohydrolase